MTMLHVVPVAHYNYDKIFLLVNSSELSDIGMRTYDNGSTVLSCNEADGAKLSFELES